MSKKFNREKAKGQLENIVVDTVQKFCELEGEKADQKNKLKSKFHEDLPNNEGVLKKFENIRTKLCTFLFCIIFKMLYITNIQCP